MAAKKIKTMIKLNLKGGEATPAPPLGPTLAQHGIPIMDFVKAYNDRTSGMKGNVVPVVITIYENKTFDFETKLAPVSELIKKELGGIKGSAQAGKVQAGRLNKEQVKKIAEKKLPDLNTTSIEAAMKIVEGTARSMGVKVES